MPHAILIWFQDNTLPIVLILVISALIAQFGNTLLAMFIRRLVGRIRTDNSKDDVKKRQDTLISMFGTMLTVLVWLTASFTILKRMGIDLTPLLAGASVLGVALGFGAQSLIKDMLSGLFIIIENQYRVGDVVEIQDATGVVEQITIRSTIIRDADGNVHFVPNGTIAQVTNKTMGYSNINFPVSVAADTDIDSLTNIINDVGAKLASERKWENDILEAPHFLTIGNFAEDSVEALVIGRTKPSDQWDIVNEFRKRLMVALKKHGIKVIKMPAAQAPPKKNSAELLSCRTASAWYHELNIAVVKRTVAKASVTTKFFGAVVIFFQEIINSVLGDRTGGIVGFLRIGSPHFAALALESRTTKVELGSSVQCIPGNTHTGQYNRHEHRPGQRHG